jgi:DNA-binding SARP family transcriptional activator
VLFTRPSGDLLEIEPEQLDAARFEHGLRHGQQLLESGDPSAAANRLRQALALWRGPPLADPSMLEFVQPEIRRLEELRLLAVMERIDADLALGHHADLLGELQSLVESEPLQERLRGQLMLASYRAVRQADALAVYRSGRVLTLGITRTR